MTLNRQLLIPKLFYVFFYAAAGSLFPFLALYYRSIGLSGYQIGLLVGLPPMVMLVGAPLLGGLADATQQHQRLLSLAIASTGLAVFALLWTTTFVWLVPIVLVYAFFQSPIMPLSDNSVIALLGQQKNQYGKVRLWGTVGWGTAGPIVGWLAERADLLWTFYIYLGLTFCLLVISLRMPIRQTSLGQPFWLGIRSLLKNWQWIIFLGLVFTAGMGLSLINNYLFLYMEDIGASRTLMGLALTVSTLSQLIIMYYSDRLLKRWGSQRLLIFVLLILAVRLFGYTVVVTAWLVLVLQLLHGPTFGALWVAGVARADELAPPGLGATAQGLFTAVTMGLGAAFGAVVGGSLYENFGAASTFGWMGLAMLAGLFFFAITTRRTLILHPSSTKP